MSTRSGKNIHLSFHEKSEANITKSERKTRSKHFKENVDELNASPKHKKRNYVTYPAEEPTGGVDTVDSIDDAGRTTRALRNHALKERNCASYTESVEPSVDSRQPVRSTRRTRKFAENEVPAVAPQDEQIKPDTLKPKKSKKKKKAEQEQVTENVTKKKSKKRKGKRSSSMVVEDIEPHAPAALNKSNMSVDSFHSATDSPRDKNEAASDNFLDEVMKTSIGNDMTSGRKTRSAVKLDYTLTNDIDPKRSSVKGNLESTLKDTSFERDNLDSTVKRQLRKRKSSMKDVSTEEVMNNYDKDTISKNTIDKTLTPNKSFDKVEINLSNKAKKGKSIVGETFDAIENVENVDKNIINTTFEMDSDDISDSTCKEKKRKSFRNAIIKIAETSPLKSDKKDKQKSVIIITEKVEGTMGKKKSITNVTHIVENSPFKFSPLRLFSEDKQKVTNTTFEKDSDNSDEETIKTVDATFDIVESSSPFKSANEVSSPIKSNKKDLKCKSIINTTYEKDSETDNEKITESPVNITFDKDEQDDEANINTPLEKEDGADDVIQNRKSLLRISSQNSDINSTFDTDQKKLDATFDKNSKSSLISSDNSTLDKSEASRISITDDESQNATKENIMNTTPLLIESSLDESHITLQKTPDAPITPLKREGTFTKEETTSNKTPTKQMSLPSAGFTPFHVNKSSSKKLMNITRSIEKRRSSVADLAPRTTKVMFCSPVNNPAVVAQHGRKVIKSNLKGSNKSFIFDDSVCLEPRPSNRKRSFTQNDADTAHVKRKRLAEGMQQSVERLSRPRTSSASAKLEPTTPKKPTTPSKKDKGSRTKLPNFAALHQKEFDRMESLSECQERRAKRAKQLLTPTAPTDVLDRISPKDKVAESEKPAKEAPKKPETPVKSLPTFKSLNPGYTRFGFRLNLDVNPFSIPSKAQQKPKENRPNGKVAPAFRANGLAKVVPLTRQATLPSLTGATSVRREAAKQTVMREKSFTDRRNEKRTENRTVIKGVRTNRRFELQMRMRDI